MKIMKICSNAHDILKRAKQDYAYNDDVMCADDERVRKAKKAISTLPDADKNIMLLYCEYNSIRKLAEELKVSRSLLHREIARIRQTIIASI